MADARISAQAEAQPRDFKKSLRSLDDQPMQQNATPLVRGRRNAPEKQIQSQPRKEWRGDDFQTKPAAK